MTYAIYIYNFKSQNAVKRAIVRTSSPSEAGHSTENNRLWQGIQHVNVKFERLYTKHDYTSNMYQD
jgi:hypothetical protein